MHIINVIIRKSLVGRKMNNENFKLLDKTKKTANYIKNITINIPKSERILKDSIEKTIFQSIENTYYYIIQNNENNRIKDKYLKDLLVNFAMLDYFMKYCKEGKYISKHQCDVVCKFLLELRKITYGIIRANKI